MENLTNEELVQLYQDNKCETIFNELYIRNKGLVHDVMKKYKNAIILNENDINSSCHLGFIQAVNAYKCDNGCKFSSYCYSVMVKEMIKHVQYAGRKMRNHLDQSFVYLDDRANDGEASTVIDIIDLSNKDALVRKDYTYLNEAIEHAKGLIYDKYHPYLVPILHKEISTYKVADLIGVSRKTVQYTITRFRRLVSDYINNYFSEIEKVSK